MSLPAILIVAPLAAIAWRLRWLTLDGAAAAWIIGSTILALGGPYAAVALVVFFATGTALTFVGRHKKTQPEHRRGGRDAAQVFCTGGVAALAVAGGALFRGAAMPATVWQAAFLGSLAAAAADTWATEIGMLSSASPRLITSWRSVPAGTSGAVTLSGNAAGVAGAAAIAGLAPLVAPAISPVSVIAAGVVGMAFDSLLGATVQALYTVSGGPPTEMPTRNATLVRGLRWMTNPVVNLAATTLGAVVAAMLHHVL
jgi:uncharacterized protein (TIGR00297 family)